jgi:hypothetical protein
MPRQNHRCRRWPLALLLVLAAAVPIGCGGGGGAAATKTGTGATVPPSLEADQKAMQDFMNQQQQKK